MYIKPKPEPKKPKQPKQEKPKPSPEHPEYVRIKKLPQEELDRLSRDYVLAHGELIILSLDYVIEHGKMFGENLWWDRQYGYYICDFSGDEEIYYTGLAYGIYKNGNLQFYRYYKNGSEDGIEAKFYPSGVLKSYAVIYDENKIALAYEWDECGRIRGHYDGQEEGYRIMDEEGYLLMKNKV